MDSVTSQISSSISNFQMLKNPEGKNGDWCRKQYLVVMFYIIVLCCFYTSENRNLSLEPQIVIRNVIFSNEMEN